MALQAITPLFLHTGLGALGAAVDLGLAGGGLALAGTGLAAWTRRQRKAAVRLELSRHGLTPEATDLLAERLVRDGADAARMLLANPQGLRQRLAHELSQVRRLEEARDVADRCAQVCDGLRMRVPPYPAAPLLFEEVLLRDEEDPSADPVPAWVTRVEDERLALASPAPCPWPVRRDLLLERPTSGEAAVHVSLLMRPSQGSPEWIVDHDFDYGGPERRAARRHRARTRIAAWAFPCTAGAYTLRARLQQDEPVDTESLRRLRGWPERKPVEIQDLSSDGCRLSLSGDVCVGERFYVALSHSDGTIAALPLAEVVSVRVGPDDDLLAGMRFRAVRLKERLLLADFAASLDEAATPS